MNIFEKFCADFGLEYDAEMNNRLRVFAHAVDSTISDKPIAEVRVLLRVMANQILFEKIVQSYFSEYLKKS